MFCRYCKIDGLVPGVKANLYHDPFLTIDCFRCKEGICVPRIDGVIYLGKENNWHVFRMPINWHCPNCGVRWLNVEIPCYQYALASRFFCNAVAESSQEQELEYVEVNKDARTDLCPM